MFVGRRGVRIVRVHHLQDVLRGEHLGGVGRPGDDRFELILFGPPEEVDGVVWWPVKEPETGMIGYVREDELSPTR